MPIPLIGAGIAAGGSIISGLLGSSASKKAANQQANEFQQIFNNTSAAVAGGQANVGNNVGIANTYLANAAQAYNPYAAAGTAAIPTLQGLISGPNSPLNAQFSFNPSDLQNDPGYQFTLSQGQQAIQRAAAAQGGLFSSGTLKSLAGYTTGTADQYFTDAYNRALSTFNTNRQGTLQQISGLQNLAQMGYNATGAQAGLTTQQANNSIAGAEFGANLGIEGANTEANALAGKGNAQAAGTVGSANAITGALAGATNAFGQGLNVINSQNNLQTLLGSLNTNQSVPTTGTFPQTSTVASAPAASSPFQYYNPATGGMSNAGYNASNTQGGGIG